MKKGNKILETFIFILIFATLGIILISGARLPTVGSDTDNWGTILNEFLQTEHNSSGSHTDITARSVMEIRNAAEFSGSDIGTKINAAIADLPENGGKIIIPPGDYTFADSIEITKRSVTIEGAGRQSGGLLDHTTKLTYTGSGTAILLNTSDGVRIKDLALFGNANAQIGIHLFTVFHPKLENILIQDFSNSSAIGIKIEATDTRSSLFGHLENVQIFDVQYGIKSIGTATKAVNNWDYHKVNIALSSGDPERTDSIGIELGLISSEHRFYGGNIARYETGIKVDSNNRGPYIFGMNFESNTIGINVTNNNAKPFIVAALHLNSEDINYGGSEIFYFNTYDSKFSIDSSGNAYFAGDVGIGTTSPDSKLHLLDSNDSIIHAETTGSAKAAFFEQENDVAVKLDMGTYGSAHAGGALFGKARANHAFIFSTGASETGLTIGTLDNDPLTLGTTNIARMTILGGGNVGIGITSPSAKLEINGTSIVPLILVENTTAITCNSGSAGGIIYFSNKHYGCDGSTWNALY